MYLLIFTVILGICAISMMVRLLLLSNEVKKLESRLKNSKDVAERQLKIREVTNSQLKDQVHDLAKENQDLWDKLASQEKKAPKKKSVKELVAIPSRNVGNGKKQKKCLRNTP